MAYKYYYNNLKLFELNSGFEVLKRDISIMKEKYPEMPVRFLSLIEVENIISNSVPFLPSPVISTLLNKKLEFSLTGLNCADFDEIMDKSIILMNTAEKIVTQIYKLETNKKNIKNVLEESKKYQEASSLEIGDVELISKYLELIKLILEKTEELKIEMLPAMTSTEFLSKKSDFINSVKKLNKFFDSKEELPANNSLTKKLKNLIIYDETEKTLEILEEIKKYQETVTLEIKKEAIDYLNEQIKIKNEILKKISSNKKHEKLIDYYDKLVKILIPSKDIKSDTEAFFKEFPEEDLHIKMVIAREFLKLRGDF